MIWFGLNDRTEPPEPGFEPLVERVGSVLASLTSVLAVSLAVPLFFSFNLRLPADHLLLILSVYSIYLSDVPTGSMICI